jgi:predicted metalloprotease with PDZ domain
VIQLPSEGDITPDVALLVAHEALHLWNGHHLVPEVEAEASTRWFKEGVTHYLAVKYALRWGLVDFDFATAEFAEIASNYLRNPLSRGASGRQLDHIRFPYDQGALLALEVDAALARSSNGEVGIEDWLRAVDAKTKSGRYNRETLTVALRSVATPVGSDAPAVMRRHLDDPGPVDIRALFHRADLHWLPSDRSRTARVIALERAAPLYALLFGPGVTP